MAASIGWNLVDIAGRGETWMRETGEMIGLAFHIPAVVFLILAPQELSAQGRRGALVKAAVTLVAGMAVGILVGWGLLELFPGTLERDYRLAYAVHRVAEFARVGFKSL